MTYLMIENKGVAPIEAYTLLGMSSTRNCGADGAIGQFGSGNKHAINVLLREDVDFKIYSGLTQLSFTTEKDEIADGLDVTSTEKVKCQLKGGSNRTIDCGWCLDFGSMTWNSVDMALREFISNCLDRTLRESGGFREGLVIEEVDKPRAKAGTTRVFVEMTPEVAEYYLNIDKHFLHFSNDNRINECFLDKKTPGSPRIYREGVYIRTLDSSHDSVFDYNFPANSIEIDECRNSSEYALRATIGQLINKAETETIAELFEAMKDGDTFESDLDDYYLSYSKLDSYQQNWQDAWKQVAGDAVIAAEVNVDRIVEDLANHKGFQVRKIKSQSFAKTAQAMGVSTLASAVGQQAVEGRIEGPASQDIMSAVDRMWGLCVRSNMTNGKDYPGVTSFSTVEEHALNGYTPWGEARIMVRETLSGHDLDKTILEQLGQHICGSSSITSWAMELILVGSVVGV